MDFDDFNDPAFAATTSQNTEVVDFLKREQEALGEFAAPVYLAPPTENDFFGEDFGGQPEANAIPEATSAANPFGAAEPSENTEETDQPAYYVSAQTEYVDPYAALSQVNDTPQVIHDWRQKRDDMLEKKDQQSREKLQKMERDAKAALDKLAQEYQTKKSSTQKKNRETQATVVALRDAPLKGNPWERVYNLVDLNPKGQKSNKDVTRIRTILTQLKSTPNPPGVLA